MSQYCISCFGSVPGAADRLIFTNMYCKDVAAEKSCLESIEEALIDI